MKNMSQAVEFTQAAPPGRRLSTIIAAEATASKKSGASMLHLTVAIADGSQWQGQEADDYIITDGTAKGAAMGKKKLRGIGTPDIARALDTDEEIPDGVIAQGLLGLQLFVDYGNEQKMGKDPNNANDPSAPYDRPMTILDETTGRTVALNKLVVQGYSRNAVGTATSAPAQQAQVQAPPQSFVPQQFAPQAQQYAPPAPQQFAPAYAAPGFAAPMQPGQFSPNGPQQQAFGFPGQQAQPAWNGQQAQVQQQAQPEGELVPRKSKKAAANNA